MRSERPHSARTSPGFLHFLMSTWLSSGDVERRMPSQPNSVVSGIFSGIGKGGLRSERCRAGAVRLGPRQLAHGGDQVFEPERLHERLRRAGLAGDLEHVVIPQRLIAGHRDDLHPGKLPAHVADRLDALFLRHEDVGDDHVGWPRALQRQPLNAVHGALDFDAAALKPAQRKHPEVVAVVDDENARHVPAKGRRNADFMQSAADNPPKAVFLLRRHRGRYPGGVQSQSSVNASQAMLSQATLSQATLSHATLSQATLSQATLSQATLSQAKLSQATLFQTRVS